MATNSHFLPLASLRPSRSGVDRAVNMTTCIPDEAHEPLQGSNTDLVRQSDLGNIENHSRLAMQHRGHAVHCRLSFGNQGAVEGDRARVVSPVELHPQQGSLARVAIRSPSAGHDEAAEFVVTRSAAGTTCCARRSAAGERARSEEETRDDCPTSRDCRRPPECRVVAVGEGESAQRAMANERCRGLMGHEIGGNGTCEDGVEQRGADGGTELLTDRDGGRCNSGVLGRYAVRAGVD